MKKHLVNKLISIVLMGLIITISSCDDGLNISQSGDIVSFKNKLVSLDFDLAKGNYNVSNLNDKSLVIKNAYLKINEWTSDADGGELTWSESKVDNEFGKGRVLRINIQGENRPQMIFKFILYKNKGFLDISGGIVNTTGQSIQVKDIYVLAKANLYDGTDISENFAMVDGFSGGEPLEYGKRRYSPLTRENALKSRNNILLTFGNDLDRHILLMGGLSYNEFEKYAFIEQSRRTELEKGPDGLSSLLCYLDLPDDKKDIQSSGEKLYLVRGDEKRTWQNHEFRCTETATSAMDEERIVIEAAGLRSEKNYLMGLSWWRGLWHGDRGDHWQSVFAEYEEDGKITRVPLIKDHLIAQFDGRRKKDVEQIEIPIPNEVISKGQFRIIVEKPSQPLENNNDDNVYLSEIWLRDGDSEALLPSRFTQINDCPRPRRKYTAQLFAKDPVGKKVDPGTRYIPEDRFYIDVVSTDPFEALENYGLCVSKAQGIELSMYDFPSVCLWYAEVDEYGGGMAENTTLGAVNEMKIIRDKGFLKYGRAAVRLVPDSYMPDNQQGWWDDEHWQKDETDRNASENGRYVEPYETSEKWGEAVTDLGGIPLTYFQAGFRSEDYARTYPGHMLFNNSYAWRGEPQDTASEMFTTWNQTWTRNRRVWAYDYTDPDFLKHLKDVYKNLASGGIRGLMFDYPGYAWSYDGGFEDKYSTTAAAYRNIFRMPYEGLGPGSYVHERNMERGTDVSIGYVASMRTENDTDRMDATTVTRCGLRWYKNRVLYNQDTDSKNIARLQDNQDDVRAVLTMAYVTTGRLLLANSFAQFTDQTLRDITRTFPYHTENKSARPIDAFVSEYPMVYDFEVSDQWHQVTFFNGDFENNKTIGIALAGQPVNGALNFDPQKSYYVYDFWNDSCFGKMQGSERLEQELRPGEARMLSVREALEHPQVLSTNRHIMQGYLDMKDVEWDQRRKTLSGTSKVVGGDPYVVTIAGNGFASGSVSTNNSETSITSSLDSLGLVKITIETVKNADVEWEVKFQ